MQTTITINESRLQAATITVTAESTAEIALHTPRDGGNTYYALLVDGRYHDLIMWKHTVGCAEATESLDRALSQVRAAIAHLQPPPFDGVVAAALERLASENAQSARTARQAGEKEDAAFFQRAANAYTRALEAWNAGTRPTRTTAGNWLLPSRTGGAAHLLTMDGDWICSCQAGESMHWAKALIIGLEVAGDDVGRFDDGADYSEVTTEPPTPAELGARLCRARDLVMGRAA